MEEKAKENYRALFEQAVQVLRDLRDAAYAKQWENVAGILWGDVVSELVEHEQ